MNWQRLLGGLLIAAGLTVLGLKLGKVYDPSPAVERAAAKAGPAVSGFVKKVQADRVVYAVLVCLPVCIGAVFLFSSSRPRPGEEGAESVTEEAAPAAAALALKSASAKARKKAVHTCNVLQATAEPRQLWQFDARNGGFVLNRAQATAPGEPLPPGMVS